MLTTSNDLINIINSDIKYEFYNTKQRWQKKNVRDFNANLMAMKSASKKKKKRWHGELAVRHV